MRALNLGLAATALLARSAARIATCGLVGGTREIGPVVPAGRPQGQRWTVLADDGVVLHAEVDGDPCAPLTVVLCHGYALTGESWCFQRAALADWARVVVWDQRGHGWSERGPAAHATIDQLGRDLLAVLEQTATTGPVVLVGHSMGGMAIMALAEQRPDLFGDRIAGVALLGTSAGPVTVDFGLPSRAMDALHHVAPWAMSALCRVPALARFAPVRDLLRLLVGRHAFGSEVPPAVGDFLVGLIESVSLDVLADFFPQFRYHDKRAALSALADVACLVMAGEHDLLTPCRDSETIVAAVPHAEYVVVPGAGHAFPLERPDLVNTQLSRFLDGFVQLRSA
ncbi:alpha/beta hydrolase [Amycolatopsis sp. K13G38]|uniref:Alpha/beta hydrolase n=1 Tax=Amycolatopsis acididurans TaxID=2724524 RepID=A0ABX1JFX6_9PSEU|nr:alpha/beta hydrolase [Amycolatopsis acididurans]NKQ58693.1 alpha/beta hydrolase [Amycolatopsis acididurans]